MMSELTARSRRARAADASADEAAPEPAAPVNSDVAPDDDAAPTFSVALDRAATLPSRKPLTSWAELETSAVVESPADDLFGTPGEKPKPKFRSALGAAFAEFDAAAPDAAAPETAVPEVVVPETVAPEAAAETAAPEAPASATAVPEVVVPETVAPEAAAETAAPEAPAPATAMPDVAMPETLVPETLVPETLAPEAPAAKPVAETTPTYDEPIGPLPKPANAETPRRERSAATIASLLTEALAAYQSGTEEEEPSPPAALDPFDSFLRDSAHGSHRAEPGPVEGTDGRADSGFRGRHRTPE